MNDFAWSAFGIEYVETVLSCDIATPRDVDLYRTRVHIFALPPSAEDKLIVSCDLCGRQVLLSLPVKPHIFRACPFCAGRIEGERTHEATLNAALKLGDA